MEIEIIQDFCAEFDYPNAICEALQNAYARIAANGEATNLLKQNRQLLWDDQFGEMGEELIRLDKIAEITELHPYTIYLLFYVLCAPEAKRRYQDQGISPDIYRSSMLALKWKMQKTCRIYGIPGTGWAMWFRPFFQLRRFGIGRLEFELSPSEADYQKGNNRVRRGDTVINVHIPASGPLNYDAVLESYRRAADFFRASFPNGVVTFQCHSWLLYPPVLEMVPQGNLWTFSRDYEIVDVQDVSPEDDRWRVFHVPNTVPVEAYPEDTTLQRRLKAWLLEGHTMGAGLGMFFYTSGAVAAHDNGEI